MQAKGNVEIWLKDLLEQAQWSLHVVIRDASVSIQDPTFDMMNFFNSFPAQVSDSILSFVITSENLIF